MVKKNLLLFALAIFMAAGIAGSALAEGPQGSARAPGPQSIIHKMLERFILVESFEYSGKVEAEFSAGDPALAAPLGSYDFTVVYSGKADAKKTGNSELHFSVKAGLEDIAGRTDLGFDFELRFIGEIVYLRINKIDNYPNPAAHALMGQWIRIDVPALKAEHLQGQAGDRVNTTRSRPVMTSEEEARARKLMADIVKVVGDIPAVKIGDTEVYRCRLAVSKENIIEFVKLMIESVQGSELRPEDAAALKYMFDGITFSESEILIGKDDFLPYRFKAPGLIFDDAGGSGVSGRIDFDFNLKNYNKPVTIDAPVGAKTIEEIFGP